MGAANVASGMTRGYPVSGGLARSAVNLDAGAATPLSAVLTAILVLVVVAAVPHMLSVVPHAVLAATIFAAGASQLGFSDFPKAWKWNRAEGVSYLTTLAGVTSLGLTCGLLTGVDASIALVIVRSICPTINTIAINPEDGADPLNRRLQVTVYGDIKFLSAPCIADEIVKTSNGAGRPQQVRLLSADRRAMDFTADERLKTLAAQLHKNGVQLAYNANRDSSQKDRTHNSKGPRHGD